MNEVIDRIDRHIEILRERNGFTFEIKEPFDYEGYYKNLRPKGMHTKRYKRELCYLVTLYRMRVNALDKDKSIHYNSDSSLNLLMRLYSVSLWSDCDYKQHCKKL